MAKKKGIKIGPPVPLPSPQLGLFGSITPLRSFPSNREALFDFALSGPAASLVASLACVLGGIFASLRATPIDLVHFPVVPAALLKSSFLIGTFFSWFAPKVMMIPLAQPVPVHPLFVVGFSGLISSALNLLPLFRLDGGRACSAVMGPRQGALISVATLFFMLPHALSGTSGILLAWGLMIALFQRRAEIPARDEVTEVSNLRRGVWFFSFVLSLTILAPFPGASGIL
jgi:membrane-associated protease RseP (regulator of RpoE activity)